jgi:hypothetical protein
MTRNRSLTFFFLTRDKTIFMFMPPRLRIQRRKVSSEHGRWGAGPRRKRHGNSCGKWRQRIWSTTDQRRVQARRHVQVEVTGEANLRASRARRVGEQGIVLYAMAAATNSTHLCSADCSYDWCWCVIYSATKILFHSWKIIADKLKQIRNSMPLSRSRSRPSMTWDGMLGPVRTPREVN